MGRRMKIIESSINNIMQLMRNLDITTKESINKLSDDIEKLKNDIEKIKKDIDNLNIKIKSIVDQLSLFALSDRVKYIERYIEYLDPYQFLTKKEAERLIEKKIKEILGENKEK